MNLHLPSTNTFLKKMFPLPPAELRYVAVTRGDMKRFACLAALLLQSAIMPAQQFSSVPGQGRSMVVSKFGIVSTPQFLASQAGAHILEEGGNAIDAAIAA